MDVRIEPSWKAALAAEFEKPYFKALADFVRAEYVKGHVCPLPHQLFAAFDATPFDAVRVVILGQDPYHGPGQAHGLCFSVAEGVRNPPSLQNIYKELVSDLGAERGAPVTAPANGDLTHWARQGVLLLNATLTVALGQAGSHQGKGWEQFTDAAIAALNTGKQGLVFVLWGSYAQKKGALIDRSRHTVISSPHPSPLSAHAGFFGSRPFSKVNAALVERSLKPIMWV